LNSSDQHKGLRAVAVLEAGKGLVVLIAGMILLFSFRENAGASATHLIEFLHLNPTGSYASRFIRTMALLDNSLLGFVAGGAFFYSVIRFIEAYGLWKHYRWAEWLAALGGAIYIPIEVYELWRHPTWMTVAALGLNMIIVIYMAQVLRESTTRHAYTLEKT